MSRLALPFTPFCRDTFLKGSTMEEKISKEIAMEEFDRFAKTGRLRVNGVRSEEDEKKFNLNKARFIEEVMFGKIIVDDDGWPTVDLGNQYEFINTVKWSRRPNGNDLCVFDRHMNKQVSGKYAWVSSTTGVSPGVLRKLDDVDFEVIQAVQELF